MLQLFFLFHKSNLRKYRVYLSRGSESDLLVASAVHTNTPAPCRCSPGRSRAAADGIRTSARRPLLRRPANRCRQIVYKQKKVQNHFGSSFCSGLFEALFTQCTGGPASFWRPEAFADDCRSRRDRRKEWERRVLFVLTCVAEPHVRRRCEEAKPPQRRLRQ